MTPADLWLRHKTHVAELDDEAVYAAITADLDTDMVVTIVRRSSADRPQGLVIDTDQHSEIAGVEASSFVLWSDTAPAELDITIPAGRFTVSHVWRDGDITHGWTGWCGLRRLPEDGDQPDDESDRWHLVASDGHDGFSIDLDVVISFAPT